MRLTFKANKMERFKVTPVEGLDNHYILEDSQSGIICMWEKGKFNDTQEFTNIPTASANELATLMREIGDYMATNQSDKV